RGPTCWARRRRRRTTDPAPGVVSRRRRALALGALSLLLGALAVSDVAGREAALDRRVGPTVPVIVARVDLPVGAALTPGALAVRRVPTRFVPNAAFTRTSQLQGLKAAVAIPAGTDLTGPLLRDPAATATAAPDGRGGVLTGSGTLRAGERAAEVVARGDARLLGPGSRIDLLVTRETADGAGDTTLALEDTEVLAAAPATADDGHGSGGGGGAAGPRVALSLRVSLREAVALAAAQNFAKELRILVRVDGDHRHGARGMTVTDK
ncbi:MAG: cpaB, partial [Solirubrobacterales bacterium]|nr:cpaB [Solirubrobacterales bacterium]